MERRVKQALGIDKFEGQHRLEAPRVLYRAVRDKLRNAVNGLPNLVAVETTRHCNLACTYCPRHAMVEAGTLPVCTMSDTLFQHVLEASAGLPVQLFSFAGGLGEPLMDKDIGLRVEMAKGWLLDARVALVSNGTLLTDTVGDDLVDAKLDHLTLSINFSSRDRYYEHTGRDLYPQLLYNVKRFLRRKGSRPPATELQLLEIGGNMREFEAEWNGSLNANDCLKLHEMHEWTGGPRIQTGRHPCAQLWERVHVTVEGDVYPCCMAPVCRDLRLGNILDTPLSDLLDSPNLVEWRRRHMHNVYPDDWSCTGCMVWHERTPPMLKVGGRWV